MVQGESKYCKRCVFFIEDKDKGIECSEIRENIKKGGNDLWQKRKIQMLH